jgi:TolA-binding protein
MTEALADGRLDPQLEAELQRHAPSCQGCREAMAATDRVREAMTALPEAVVSDFHHRRVRQQLLVRAGGALFGGVVQGSGVRWLRPSLAVAAVALLVGVGVVALRDHGATVAQAPRYDVTGLEDASWMNQESGGTATVTLSRGSAAFHVHHLEAGQRFLVALPDGEVEVRGTRFVVDVEAMTTHYVVVMEGKVALRVRGQPERILIAGQRWEVSSKAVGSRSVATGAPVAAVAPNVSAAAASSPIAVAAHLAPREAPRAIEIPSGAPSRVTSSRGLGAPAPVAPAAPRRLTPGAPSTIAQPKITPPSSPVETPVARPESPAMPEASALFARGVAALRDGRYAEADASLREFLAKNPRDSRAEDAAFLRAVGRSRSGDDAGAAELARDYLARFPQGMRRREAESLSRRVP